MNGPPNIYRNYRQPFSQPRQWNNYGPRGFHPGNQRPQYIRPPGSISMNNDHWCETCDRGFPTAAILENHKQQHQKCNIDGCQFIAHPKVITKHIQMQHSSGLFKKIAKLNNPQEIQKWRDERKRRYPTKENVEKKVAAMKEKIERGEKMGLNNDRSSRHNTSGSGHKRKQPFGADKNNKRKMFKSRQNIDNERNQSTKSNNNKDNVSQKDTPHKLDIAKNKSAQTQLNNNVELKICDKRKLQPFTGIQNLIEIDDIDKNESLENENYIIEDDDDEVCIKLPVLKATETAEDIEPTVCGALSSLMCDYESSDEETKSKESIDVNLSTTPKTICAKNVNNVTTHRVPERKINLVDKVSKEVSDKISDDDSGPDEVKILKPGTTVVNEVNKTFGTANNKIVNKEVRKNKKENFSQKRHIQTRPKPKVPSTLLQKLLHKEIRHERNVVLQCIRYIVSNNYFDKKV